jgi:hypothetical protein
MSFDVASSIAFGAAYLGFGIGAWTLKPWAWVLGVVVGLVSIAYGLVAILLGILRGASVLVAIFVLLFGITFNGIILFYLFTWRVKRAFGRR